MDEYSLSSISNNASFLTFPMINKKQILLDWINTINEPLCLLVSEVDNLKDGKVFIEILKHYLQKESMLTGFIKDINASEKMKPLQRVAFVIEIMIKVNGNKSNILRRKFEKFYTSQADFFRNEELILDYVALLRVIYERELDNDYEEEQPQVLGKRIEENKGGNRMKGDYSNSNNEGYYNQYDNNKKGKQKQRTVKQNYSLQPKYDNKINKQIDITDDDYNDQGNYQYHNTDKKNNNHMYLRKYNFGNQFNQITNDHDLDNHESDSIMNHYKNNNEEEQEDEYDEIHVDTKYNDCNEVIEMPPEHPYNNNYHKPYQYQGNTPNNNNNDQYPSEFSSQFSSQNQSQSQFYNYNDELERIDQRINKKPMPKQRQITNDNSYQRKTNDRHCNTIEKFTPPNEEETNPHFNTNYFPSAQTQLNSGTVTLCNTNATPNEEDIGNHPHYIEIVKNDQFNIKSKKNDYQSKTAIAHNNQKKRINEKNINMTPSKQAQHNQQQQQQQHQIYTHNNNTNDFDISMISKKNSQVGSMDTSFYTQVDSNKLYNKRQKAEINMSRGMQIQNKLFKLEHKNMRIPYIKLALPTQPVIISSYNEMKKYQLIINPNRQYDRQSNFNSKSKPKESYRAMPQGVKSVREDYNPQTNINPNDIAQNIINNKPQQPNPNAKQTLLNEMALKQNLHNNCISNRTNFNTNDLIDGRDNDPIDNNDADNDIINDNISVGTKNKIYSWLIDIGILKEKTINTNDIPNICINGVLLCDLVNRCEGRNECIHGIIRKTTTKSQIQVNVNKVLVHLRSIEKFTSRHLWSNSQIVQGNSQIIWELLDDLYNFYSMKTKFVSKSKSKPKLTTMGNQQQMIGNQSFLAQDDPLINLNLDEVVPFDNNPTPRLINSREPIFYNPNKKTVSNSNNNNTNNIKVIPVQLIQPVSPIQNQIHVPMSHPIMKTMNDPIIKQDPKKPPRMQSYDPVKKKPAPLTRCNTNNEFNQNHNNLSILNTNNNNNQNNNNTKGNNTFYQNQSFNTQTAGNMNGFLLFEKSSVKRMKQNIEQISSLYADL